MSGTRAFKLFVGNLPWTVSRKELSAYFSKFGNLRSATVVFNTKSGLSKGYGFVEFAKKEGYTSAISQDHHVLENSKLTIASSSSGRLAASSASKQGTPV
ncbi:SRA stem-loop-interacting RNA-binding protein, mitochondrial-like [Babylonia areolata]|uniref:SRA stem-loop-interacting RNA-binding protein, mitochondrial-like n=1 Tax=Babylonia areolata TaxID=304850 RepID=UPI003FD45E74